MADVRVKVAEGKKLYWRGRDRTGGEIIEVPEKEARLIVAVKKGELVADVKKTVVPEPSPPPPQEVQGRSLTAEDESQPQQSGRRYKRRDLRPED